MEITAPTILPCEKNTYLVGGSVRDLLNGWQPADLDVAVQEDPETYCQRLEEKTGARLVRLGKPGKALHRMVGKDFIIDVTQIEGNDIYQDLGRRDFTINAMALDLESGNLLDPFHGRSDLTEKIIRKVSDGIFGADPLRLLRAFRLQAFLGFTIAPETLQLIRKEVMGITNVAGERIRDELKKMFASSTAASSLQDMSRAGLLTCLFPELSPLQECHQNAFHDFDVYDHTIEAFCRLERILNNDPDPSPLESKIFLSSEDRFVIKLAVLLHDIGKPATRQIDQKGRIRFKGHASKGADMAAGIFDRLRLSNTEKRRVDFIVRHHLRPLSLFIASESGTLTRKGLSHFLIQCGPLTPAVIIVALADMMAKRKKADPRTERFIRFAGSLLIEFDRLRNEILAPSPLITGNDLIKTLGLSPSPRFKKLLNTVRSAQLAGDITTRDEALRLVKDRLRKKD